MSQSRKEIVSLINSIGKYQLQGENTQGMNAYAFTAKHVPLNCNVFLKIYDASSERVDIFQEPRFLVEATSGTSSSDHLVNVLDAEKLNDDWVLVAMEFVDGGSVLDAITNGPLPLMDAINVAMNILHGLSCLHNACLVHRDIKPANILLTNQSERLHSKFGDFGSVARLDNPNATVNASKHSALYVPPEGWQQPSAYGIRSDIYQVGLVMAELINGPLPYGEEPYLDRKAKAEIRKLGASCFFELSEWDRCQVVNNALARRSASRKILSLIPDQPFMNRTLKKVINTATHPDPKQRYRSAMDMCNALNSLHFPNWELLENGYSASNWMDWDWFVESVTKRLRTEFYIKRSRCGTDSFRRWYVAESFEEAFGNVFREG